MNPTLALSNEHHLAAEAAANPTAFAALYDHYFPRIFTYIRYRVGSDAEADDLTAYVFERALTKITAFDPQRAPFGAWLFGIARNAVGNHRRSLWRFLKLDALRQKPASAPAPEDASIDREEQDRLLAAVAHLSDRERDLIALKYGAALNNRQIAEITALTESNVGVILHRAINRLRQELGQEH